MSKAESPLTTTSGSFVAYAIAVAGAGCQVGLLKPEANPSSGRLMLLLLLLGAGTWWTGCSTWLDKIGFSAANSTVNEEPAPNPSGTTIAFTAPSGACTWIV